MLGRGQYGHSYYEEEYGGVYDLFDLSGNLLIGGFRTFKYDSKNEVIILQFGGYWNEECGEYDNYSYHFEKRNSRWLVLDCELCSIKKDSNGNRHKFRKGFIGTITPKKENGKTINYWNMPLELFSIEEPYFSHNLMLCEDDKCEWVVRISDGKTSAKHKKIGVIGNNLYFITDIDGNDCGIGIARLPNEESKAEEILIKPNLDTRIVTSPIFTHPIGGYIFMMNEIDRDFNMWGQYTVSLYNINTPLEKPIVAITAISKDKLMMLLKKGDFLITINEDSVGYSSIMLPNLEIFDEDFRTLISDKKVVDSTSKPKTRCWFTDGWHMLDSSPKNHSYSNDYDIDYTDYMRDTWDALTDGMYGDMPDGWDGDYEFLGY